MTRTAHQGQLLSGAFIVILLGIAVAFVHHDAAGLRGVAVGAAVGVLNLVVGGLMTRRTLRQGMRSTVSTLMGGFLARLVVLVVLFLLFEQTPSIDPAGFALTFLVFFFVYLALEMRMVERQSTARPEQPARPGQSPAGSSA